ncbi:MAG: hypothetical protein AAF741_16800 [Bacteroidota bacterium]
MDTFSDLDDVRQTVWSTLTRATTQRRHEWRTPVMGNTDGDYARMRTIVLRKSDTQSRSLRFYTDKRSAKWPMVKNGGTFSLLFWDSRHALQAQMIGKPVVLDRDATDHIWSSMPVHSRSSYATKAAPGSQLKSAKNGLPEGYFDMEPSETEYAKPHFGVFEIVVDWFEVLQLKRGGHRRAKFTWRASKERWMGEWIVP